MSEIVQFPTRPQLDRTAAAIKAIELIQRAEALLLTAGVLASTGSEKAALQSAEIEARRARRLIEARINYPNNTPPKGAA
jgi:hypothetical protein